MRNLFFLSLLFFFVFEAHAKENQYSLAVHESGSLDSMSDSIRLIEVQGGRIVHIFPPHILIGVLPAHIQPKVAGLKGIYQGITDLSEVADLGQEAIFAVKVWNLRFEDFNRQNDKQDACPTIEPGPIQNDCLLWQPEGKSPSKAPPYGASFYETSEYIECSTIKQTVQQCSIPVKSIG